MIAREETLGEKIQTDRQTETQTERETVTETDRDRDREERGRERKGDKMEVEQGKCLKLILRLAPLKIFKTKPFRNIGKKEY